MPIERTISLGLSASFALVVSSCSSALPERMSRSNGSCLEATVEMLESAPHSYEGRQVCITGFFGSMVPYGEDTPKLYATVQEATALSSRYVRLYLPFEGNTQERLSRYSAQAARARGVFHFEAPCWPREDGSDPDTCFPPRPMTLRHATIIFDDGVHFP